MGSREATTTRQWTVVVAIVVFVVGPAGHTWAASSFTTHVEWTEGTFLVPYPSSGLPVDEAVLDGPAAPLIGATVPVPVDPCRRDIEFDLEYEPHELDAGTDDVGASVPYLFNVTFRSPDGEDLRSMTLDRPRHNVDLGVVPAPGVYALELRLASGADVDWRVRVQGWQVTGEPTCNLWLNEVELNPGGPDAGHEWVELFNSGSEPVDVSGWLVQGESWSTYVDEAAFVVPNGSIVAPGAYLRIDLASGEFLDDVDEIVTLAHPSRGVLDRSDPITDKLDDASSNQRTFDGGPTWHLADATPGGPNA